MLGLLGRGRFGAVGRIAARLLLMATLASPIVTPVAAEAAPRAPAARATQGRPAPSAAARPRALTPEELAQRGLLGRFKNSSPASLGRVWTAGADPRTCQDAWTLSRVSQTGVPELLAFLKRTEADPKLATPMFLIRFESLIARALEASNRYEEADRFVRARLKVRLADSDSKRAFDRRTSLWRLIAELYAPTRPAEAEKILDMLVAERTALAAKTFAEFRNFRKDSREYAYGKAWYDFFYLASRYDMLRPYYTQAGRLDEALQVAREMEAHIASKTQLMLSNGVGGGYLNGGDSDARTIRTLRARIALRDGKPEAEALLRDCCGDSPELARLLLRQGKREEARIVLSRRMLEVSDEIEQIFSCLRSPPPVPIEPAIATARKEGLEHVAGAGVYAFSAPVAADQVGLLRDTGERLDHAIELADLLTDAGLADDARNVLRPTTALATLALGRSNPVTLRALAATARQERLRGAPGAAVAVWASWFDSGGQFLRDQLWRVSEDDRRRFFRDDRRNVDFYLAALREAKPADAGAQALALTLRHKGLLASVAGDMTARARARGDTGSAATLAQLVRLRAQYAGLALRNRAGAPEAVAVRRQMSELEAQLASSLGAGQAGGSALGATPQAALAALQPGEALVDFLVFADPDASPGRERMAAVVARAGVQPAVLWWDDVAPVRAAAARFRTAILAENGSLREIDAAGKALHDLLWKPLAGSLGNATRLLVAPDDVLGVVPLAALTDAAGKPLIERYQLAMLSGARDLLARPPAGRGSAALVLGNPSFGTAPGGSGARGGGQVLGPRIDDISFSPLPGTLTESREVNALLPGSRLLEGEAATKSAVVAARSPTILHLATHGFFLTGLAGSAEEGDPLVSLSRSGLAFANANAGLRAAATGGDAPGILTALEATSLDLSDTKLVVLSACETGLGAVASGEGVYGLAQALHQAGARGVLATLWPVSDEATALFMQRFYARLAAGDDPQVALRTVQRGFAAEEKWRDPVFWAPFVLTGR